MWVLDFRPAEGWHGPRSCGHARRYVMAETHPAYLDPQQAALDHVRRGRSDFRGTAARLGQTLNAAARSKEFHCPSTGFSGSSSRASAAALHQPARQDSRTGPIASIWGGWLTPQASVSISRLNLGQASTNS